MRIGLKYVTAGLAAGAAAVALAAAAPATASPNQETCVTSATTTKCQKVGNAEINSSIPAPNPGPFAVYGPFWFPD
jgi:hypothetical protein